MGILSDKHIGKSCGIVGVSLVKCPGNKLPISIRYPFTIVGYDEINGEEEAIVLLDGENMYAVNVRNLIF